MNEPVREQLTALASKIRVSRDNGMPDDQYVNLLRLYVKDPEAVLLCDSDLPAETIADIWLGLDHTQRKLSREELIELVQKILDPGPATEAESYLMTYAFEYNCLHPAKSDLLYYPRDFFEGRSDLTPEEIVDKALRSE